MKVGLYISLQCKNNPLHYKFAQLLIAGMGEQIQICSLKNISSLSCDIIHVLAGDDYQTLRVISTANKRRIPLLYSPLGKLLPWSCTSTLAAWKKKLFIKKRLISSVEVIHTWSKAEQINLLELAKITKFAYIPNTIVTNNVAPKTMCDLFNQLYEKIINTYIDKVLEEQVKKDICTLLQISLNQNFYMEPTLMNEFINRIHSYSMEQWQRVLLFADKQGISNYLYTALKKIKINPPVINVQKIDVFSRQNNSRQSDIDILATDNPEKNIYRNFVYIINLRDCGKVLLSNYISLHKLLCSTDYDENNLIEQLHINHFLEKAQQLITDLQNITGISEGFIPATLYKH